MSGTDLYRFFDIDDRLLYVGISINAAVRASQHREEKSWWPDVDRMVVDHLDIDRSEALKVEKQVIIAEKPLHNVTHNQRPVSVVGGVGVIGFNASAIVDMFDNDGVTAYNDLARAMDALAARCDRMERDGADVGGRADFLAVVDGLARSLIYGSVCDKCREIRAPFIMEIDGGWAHCGYLCVPCDEQWTDGWTTDLASLARC